MTEAFSTICREDCEDWWLSSCCGSVAEHWQLKVEGVLGSTLATAGFFYLPLFSPHNIYFIYSLALSLGYFHTDVEQPENEPWPGGGG